MSTRIPKILVESHPTGVGHVYIADILMIGINCPRLKSSLDDNVYHVIPLSTIAEIATVTHAFGLVLLNAALVIDPSEADIEQLYFLSDATPLVVYAESLNDLSPHARNLITDGTFEWVSGYEIDAGLLRARIDKVLLNHRINGTFVQQQEVAREKVRLEEELVVKNLLVEKERDVSESIIASVGSGLLIVDIEGTIILINSHTQTLLGLSPLGYVGLLFDAVLPEAFADYIRVCLKKCNDKESHSDLKRISFNGFIYQIAAYKMTQKNGSNRGLLVFIHDISEQEKLASQLYHNEKLATIGTMLSGIAHELRNPLSIISARVQRARMSPLAESGPIAKAFESIENQSHRCSTIVNSLLNFSRTSSSSYALHDAAAVLDETLTYSAYQNSFDTIEIIKHYTPGLSIFGDRSRFVQVFLNIITNAADAMNGKGVLTISIVQSSLGGTRIEIEDNGPGIPHEVMSKIFDPFFTTKDPGKGTGLGLAICQKVIVESGGAIVCSSVPGRTVFTSTLPTYAGRLI